MRIQWRLLGLVAIVIAITSQTGCLGAQPFDLRILDFDTSGVQGIWIWERDPTTGQYQRQSEIRLDGINTDDGYERLDYTFEDARLGEPIALMTRLQRDPDNPNIVTIQLLAPRYVGSDRFRASTYNASGESPLSADSLPLSGPPPSS